MVRQGRIGGGGGGISPLLNFVILYITYQMLKEGYQLQKKNRTHHVP